MIRVSAVVLAYGEEPWILQTVDALLRSVDVTVEVLLVDNGCTNPAFPTLARRPGVRMIRPGRNIGFAAGCNVGADAATGDVIALINGDAIVAADALRELAGVACRPGVGIATASIRLADRPERLNSAGNPVHFTGLSWAGAFGQEASGHRSERVVASASGAAMAIRAELWRELGGFDAAYFIYHEDTDLSLRCWQRGLTVVYVPTAVVVHHYAFSRNPQKNYLLERNRLIGVLTLYQVRTLAVLFPALVMTEVLIFCLAVAQGWWRQKASGWWWIMRHAKWIASRRREYGRQRLRSDAELAVLFTARLEVSNIDAPPALGVLNAIYAGYWRLARPLLKCSPQKGAE